MTEEERKLLLGIASVLLVEAITDRSNPLSQLKRAILGDLMKPFRDQVRKYGDEIFTELKEGLKRNDKA